MSKLPIFEHFLSVGNLEPKLKWFFKPKLKPKMFLLNRLPGRESPVVDAERIAVADDVLPSPLVLLLLLLAL